MVEKSSGDIKVVHESGLTVYVYRYTGDGQMVVEITNSENVTADADTLPDGSPRIRIYINEARVFDEGEAVPEEKWAK